MNRSRHFFRALLVACALAATVPAFETSAAQEAAAQAPMLLPVDEAALTIQRDNVEIARFAVEIADDATERSRGLMFRTEFPGNRAMLFVFEQSRPVSFWMKNTPRSLDLLFVADDGELKTIARDATPFSVASIPSGVPVRYVVEINAGLANLLGLQPGDLVIHPRISERGE